MKAIYLFLLISFLLYGMNAVTDLGGDDYSDGEGIMIESPEGYTAKIHGLLATPVTVFQPDLTQESLSAAEDSIVAYEYFPACDDCGPAEFHWRYDKGKGVQISVDWNGRNDLIVPDFDEFGVEYYNGALSENAAWYMTTADLDWDGIPELLVAFHDGVIDGVLHVYKPYVHTDSDDEDDFLFQPEPIGSIFFQNDIYVDEVAHIITSIGSQGLYEEHVLEDGELKLLYSPSNP